MKNKKNVINLCLIFEIQLFVEILMIYLKLISIFVYYCNT